MLFNIQATLTDHLSCANFPDKRKRDLDNYNKIILDSLEDTILVDDKQIKRLCITKHQGNVGKIIIEIKKWQD